MSIHPHRHYVHTRADWPKYHWDANHLADRLAAVRHRQGLLLGRMQGLGFRFRDEAMLESLTNEVQKSSEIEGEFLPRNQVRSSIARRLGIDVGALPPAARSVEGVVEMTLDATQNYAAPLTAERLYAWYAALFPTGRSGMTKILVASWRNDHEGPMQVVSGPIGRERVHYEAPAASRLDEDMKAFLVWFESPSAYDPVLKAAVAHLWFLQIHPFDDGNGRIGRAILDMALARSEGVPQRFYSISSQISKEVQGYYDALEAMGTGDLDITSWVRWFLDCLDLAIQNAQSIADAALAKARFWESLTDIPLNERQKQMLNLLLDGFEGKLTAKKWATITKRSHDTALRDIEDLIGKSILVPDAAGGRSASYSLSPRWPPSR